MNCLPSPRVPPELIMEVIDYFHDDKQTLAAFSLVSKFLVEPSRRYLFRKVLLVVHEKTEERTGIFWDRDQNWQITLNPKSTLNGDRDVFAQFSNVLVSAPSICEYVQEMCVTPEVSERMGQHRWSFRNTYRQSLESLLSKLPRLKELRLSSVEVLSADDALDPFKYKLRKVSMSPRDILSLNVLAMFSEVKELEVSSQHLVYGHGTLLPLHHTLQVETLKLDGPHFVENFLDVFRGTPSLYSLKSLSLSGCLLPSDLLAVGRLVLDAASSLSHFHFDTTKRILELGPVPPEEWRLLNLSHCSALRSVQLTVRLPTPYERQHNPSQLFSLLSFCPPTAKDITIIFATPIAPAFNLSRVDWHNICLFFSHIDVEKFNLDFSKARVDPPDAREFLSQVFPVLAAQRKLHVINPVLESPL